MTKDAPKQSKPRKLSLQKRFDAIRKNAKRVFKLQHGNGKMRKVTQLTDTQVWHYIQQ